MHPDFDESEDRERESLEAELRRARQQKEALEQASLKSSDKDRLYIWGGIWMATFMLFAGMGLYAYPSLFADEETINQQQAIMRLEECRQVFQAIAVEMSRGQAPNESVSCPGTSIPNIISRIGNTIRVSHPNPGQFGLAEVSVTNESTRVSLIGPAGEELSNWNETTRFYAN